MRKTALAGVLLAISGPLALAQDVKPVWVQHMNGLVNVDPASQNPIVKANPGARYSANGIGRSHKGKGVSS